MVFAQDRRSLYSHNVDAADVNSLKQELNRFKISTNVKDCNYENAQLQSIGFYGNEWPS